MGQGISQKCGSQEEDWIKKHNSMYLIRCWDSGYSVQGVQRRAIAPYWEGRVRLLYNVKIRIE